MADITDNRVNYFEASLVSRTGLPERFTFPFYYEPHPLALQAAAELQAYLETEAQLEHNFGLPGYEEGMVIGKMFGVLVVQDRAGCIGYLSAFSGKLAGSNDHPRFVPPVFDMLTAHSFFLREQELINAINDKIDDMQGRADFLHLQKEFADLSEASVAATEALRLELKINKQDRDRRRAALQDTDARVAAETELVNESLHDKRRLRDLTAYWKQRLESVKQQLDAYTHSLEQLRTERKERSAALQQQLFERYVFLNKDGKEKSLQEIFSQTSFGKPPSAAGECATPKLLQYAFLKGFRPLAMAEFWWGASPKSEIRRHRQFYPACTGKCKPILAHMLEGIPLDDDPFLLQTVADGPLDIIYEDESFVVINKPHGLRSVPGVTIADSVYTRLKRLWGNAEPLIVHRLDMDTSGLLVVARTPAAHKHIQKQFLQRTVRKRYAALLSGRITGTEGEITLPLTADLFNRPRQLVCFETGKKSVTRWRVVAYDDICTKVSFWPLTGRTHQLRMHAAHELGLHAPIVGDDLYGSPAGRMYLHAAELELIHPVSKLRMHFEAPENF